MTGKSARCLRSWIRGGFPFVVAMRHFWSKGWRERRRLVPLYAPPPQEEFQMRAVSGETESFRRLRVRR